MLSSKKTSINNELKIHPIENYFEHLYNTKYEIITPIKYPITKKMFKNKDQFIKFEDIDDNFSIEICEQILKWYNLNNIITNNYINNKEAKERYIEKDYINNKHLYNRIRESKGNIETSYYNINYIENQYIKLNEFLNAKTFASKIMDKINPRLVDLTFDVAKKMYKPDIKFVNTKNTISNESIELNEIKWNNSFRISKKIFDNIFYNMLVYFIIKNNLVNCINKTLVCNIEQVKNIKPGLCYINEEQIINLLNTNEGFMLVIKNINDFFIDFYNGMYDNNSQILLNEEKTRKLEELIISITIKFYSIINLILEGFIKTNMEKILIKNVNDKFVGLYGRDDKIQSQSLQDIKDKLKSNTSTGTSYFDLETGEDILSLLKNDEEKINFIKKFKESTNINKLNCNNFENYIIPKITVGGYSNKHKTKFKSKYKTKSKTKIKAKSKSKN